MPDGNTDSGNGESLGTINLEDTFKTSDGRKDDQPVSLTEGNRLSFARQILLWLVIITVFSFGAFILAPENKGAQQVFELIKVGVLPLVTLVIGFYFPNSRK